MGYKAQRYIKSRSLQQPTFLRKTLRRTHQRKMQTDSALWAIASWIMKSNSASTGDIQNSSRTLLNQRIFKVRIEQHENLVGKFIEGFRRIVDSAFRSCFHALIECRACACLKQYRIKLAIRTRSENTKIES